MCAVTVHTLSSCHSAGPAGDFNWRDRAK